MSGGKVWHLAGIEPGTFWSLDRCVTASPLTHHVSMAMVLRHENYCMSCSQQYLVVYGLKANEIDTVPNANGDAVVYVRCWTELSTVAAVKISQNDF